MHGNHDFIFQAIYPFRKWHGRYSRVPGRATTFTINYSSEHGCYWPVIRQNVVGGLLTCPALKGGDVETLTEAVNEAKIQMTRTPGGSFCINEFGQVIVPSSDGDGTRLLIGECEGVLLFEGDEGMIDLADANGLVTGDSWEKSYIGNKYQLHNNSFIYYWGESVQKPLGQDKDLIRKMRRIRRHGAASFIVNPYGIVLMKSTGGDFDFEENWSAVYVSRIDHNLWFEKEEM